ncbi:MAG TPA: hypothetical protein VHG93_27075 [Longimicrobium sp.]|nr:hypothetical protein [Longimicrobium sp.]
MIRTMRRLAAGAVLALAAVLGGCAGYGYQDGYGGGGWGTPSELHGRVEGVQTRLRTIQLRRDNGRRVAVRYDGRTEVSTQGRRDRAESLDPGDYVTMRVSRDSRGRLYARYVNVRREAREVYRGDRERRGDDRWDDRRRRDERRRDNDRYDERRDERTATGRVGRVDRARGRFELRTDRGTVWVSVPSDLSRADTDRFRRLRGGEHVTVSGRYVSRERFEMERFR